MDLNKYIEYTNLKNDATSDDIAELCAKAIKYNFDAVCVYPCYVSLAKKLLEDTNVNVSTVISFPNGMSSPKTKEYEAIDVMEMGADEIGVFINIGALKDKDYEYVKGEIDEIRYSIPGKTLKIIVETHKLEEEELIKIVEICNETFVNYLEIYNTKKHTEDSFKDLNIINKYKGEVLEIKVSGNIKHEDEILRLIEDGVSKVGISKISSLVKEDCMHKCEDCDCKEE